MTQYGVVQPESVNTKRLKKPAGIAYLVGRLDHSFKYYMREQLKPLGLTVSQYTALSFLADHDCINNTKLAELAMISPQSANEMVKSMESKGWINRSPHATDSRVIQITLSPAGRELLLEGDKQVMQIEKKMLVGFSDADRAGLRSLLRGSLENLS